MWAWRLALTLSAIGVKDKNIVIAGATALSLLILPVIIIVTREALRAVRPRLQMIFQDPIASLNPRRRVAEIVAEPLVVSGVRDPAERTRRVRAVMEAVGLDPDVVWSRRPHEFSGGQRQRIAIARALLLEPTVLLLDDPTSAIDPETEKEIMEAMEAAMVGRTTFIVAHRLSTLRRADQILVLEHGKLVQVGTHAQLMAQDGHYRRAILVQSEGVVA